MARPKGPDGATLDAHNVTMMTRPGGAYALTCGQCGATWDVTPKAGRLAPLYWACPNGCNVTDPEPRPEPEPAPAIYTDLGQLPAILTPAEAAALLRVSETTVKDQARAGDLPGAFKLGKVWRVERDALLAHIGRGSGTPAGEVARLRDALNAIRAETGKDYLSAADTLRAVNRMRTITQAALTGGE